MDDDAWDRCAFPGELRRHQVLALDAVLGLFEEGERRACVVMPPGSGKTVLGLEAARRLRRRTLVLTPNTAVQGQWLRAWGEFGGSGSHPLPPSGSPELAAAVTVLTYQGLSALDRAADDEDVLDGQGADLAERRRAAVRGEQGADLLDLLHPRGRDLVARAAELGPWTLVLDECHHLLETWGPLVGSLAAALGDDCRVLGLTATAPAELPERQRALHEDLFGSHDVSVPTPAAVKEGELAPYQELVYLTSPTSEESASALDECTRFAQLQSELVSLRTGTLPFVDWLWRRMNDRRTEPGGPHLSWRDLEAGQPAVARAALRLVHAGMLDLPPGARLREEHRVTADAADWAALLGAYAAEHLASSEAADDVRLLTEIRQVLPSLGWSLTARGLRAATSPIDRICALSATKAAAAVHILAEEQVALDKDLRAVVLCDFEQRGAQSPRPQGRAGTEVQPGSARLAFLALARSDLARLLRPVLCTGRTVAMRRDDLVDFRAFVPHRIADRLVAEPFEGVRSLVTVTTGEGWDARTWVPLITEWLTSGGTQVVVGTRGLLGEGWDCPALNVVIDLSSAATTTSVAQLRGRGMRLDPARPDKVADSWTVVCVADGHPRGNADYLRAVRKHERHLAPTVDGAVESGIRHCDEALGPFAAPPASERLAVNARALERVSRRQAVRERWAVGAPYAGLELTALHVRTGRPLGLPGGVVPSWLLAARTTLGSAAPAPLPLRRRRASLWPAPVGVAAATSAAATVVEGPLLGIGSGLTAGVLAGGAVASVRYRTQQRALVDAGNGTGDSASLRQLADAVADALHASGGTTVDATAVRITGGRDGWTVCELEAAPDESALFATCLDELLAPLAEPRWLVSRLVLSAPAHVADRRRLALSRALGRPIEAAVTWHAVPTWLGRSKAGVAALDVAWQRHLGAGRLVLAKDTEGVALLELLRGEDPFAVRTQLRTVWR